MITKEQIKNELEARGIVVEDNQVNKNGVLCDGFTLGEGEIRPVIYTDYYEDCYDDVTSAVDDILKLVDEIEMTHINKYIREVLMDYEKAKLTLRVCLAKELAEGVTFIQYHDLKVYIRAFVHDKASVTVSDDLLKHWGKTFLDIYEQAYENTRATLSMVSVIDILNEAGYDVSTGNSTMLALKNEDGFYGASAMIFDDYLEALRVACGVDKLYIIPSSIHEVLVILEDPVIDNMYEYLQETIQEVNETTISPEEVLSDHPYVYFEGVLHATEVDN